MTNIIKDTICDMIENHEENKICFEKETKATVRNYQEGYFNGYHDALVDLLNHLGIENKYEIYND